MLYRIIGVGDFDKFPGVVYLFVSKVNIVATSYN